MGIGVNELEECRVQLSLMQQIIGLVLALASASLARIGKSESYLCTCVKGDKRTTRAANINGNKSSLSLVNYREKGVRINVVEA